jgi:mannose-1-phosphate guanylyltransferase
MLRFHEEKGGLGTLHLITVEDPSAFGCVVSDATGRVESFVEKPPKGEEPTNTINAGTYLLEAEVLDMIPAGRNVSIERETFPKILAEGKALYAYITDDYWIDLGRPEHYLAAHRDVLSGAMPLSLEPGLSGDGATALKGHPGVTAPVHADTGVTIDASARVGPNVVLGRDCSIGAGAIVRDSVLWERVLVGAGVSIDEAIVASGSSIGARATVGRGSVIGHDTHVAAGQVLEPGSRLPAARP